MATTSRLISHTTTSLAPIQIVTTGLNYYGTIIILVVGFLGCFCNFITFTAPQLRNNSCAFYFLVATLFELFSISFGLISRFASDNLGSTLLQTNRAFCKLRAYLVCTIPLVATYLILLTSLDRCLSSSVHARLRSLSRMKVAYRAALIAALVGFSSCSHILVSYDLRPRCGTMLGGYAVFDGLFVVFWLGVMPHALMLLFGSLTLLNVRQKKRRIAAPLPSVHVAAHSSQIREQKRQRQFMIVSRLFDAEAVLIGKRHVRLVLRIFFSRRWCWFKSASALSSSSLAWSTTPIPFSDLLSPATIVSSALSCRLSLFFCTMPTTPSPSISTRCPVICFGRYSFSEYDLVFERYLDVTHQLHYRRAGLMQWEQEHYTCTSFNQIDFLDGFFLR